MLDWDISRLMIDVVIPTYRRPEDVAQQIAEVEATAGWPVRVYATCTPGSAAINRNLGLDWATSPILVMMDDDVSGMPHGWVRTLAGMILSNPSWLMLSPQLMDPGGEYGMMMGVGRGNKSDGRPSGFTFCPGRLLTACVVMRNTPVVRFDEGFVGSGWEDNAYCDDLLQNYPGGLFVVCHDVKVVHANKMANQRENYERNRQYYQQRRQRMGAPSG